jgi:hypothetical protein
MKISLEVDLFYRNRPLGHAQTKDISLGGIKLQSDKPMLSQNDLISMRLWVNGVEQTLRGLVIYTQHNFIGVMLIDMDRDRSSAMFNFLKEMQIPLKVALGQFKKSSTS